MDYSFKPTYMKLGVGCLVGHPTRTSYVISTKLSSRLPFFSKIINILSNARGGIIINSVTTCIVGI
jgi:hypothetical protein